MTSLIQTKITNKIFRIFSSTLLLFFVGVTNAALTDLGNAPLVTTTTGEVLPNLMYVLDNSGSMGWDYMPDYVNDINKCKSTDALGTFSASCGYGDPPYMTSVFNTIYYDPATTYSPGLKSDGSPYQWATGKSEMSSANTAGWTLVPRDAYNVQSTAKDSLVPTSSTTGYPDKVWCNTGFASTADLSDPTKCKQNSQYTWPSSAFNQSYTKRGYPFYYTVGAGQYCTDKNLTSCIDATAPDATHSVPAKLRWCKTAADVLLTNGACQAKYLETTPTYTFAKWTGYVADNKARIKIKTDIANTPVASPSALSITNITVNGTRIIPATPSPALTITDTSSLSQRTALATNIATAINAVVTAVSPATDFTATASGDEVIITPVGSATFTGTLAVVSTSNPVSTTVQKQAVGSFQITKAKATSSITSIKVAGVEILNSTVATAGTSDNSTSRNALADAIVSQINAYTSSPDFTALSNGASQPKITITAVTGGTAGNGTLAVTKGGTSSNLTVTAISNLAGGGPVTVTQTYTLPVKITPFTGGEKTVTTFDRVDIEPSITHYEKAATRTDCAGATTCTYDEEMTNFANWYSYYRTRMQMMKSSSTRAFKSIDSRFRVGFITISNQSSHYLPIAQFTTTQKSDWYDELLSINPSNSTPLRSALSLVGRIYAGKNPVSGFTADPVQYSCQQNFTILTTDGYWNTDSDSDVKDINGNPVGNMDGTGIGRPMYEGPTATSNTLADVAKYYYDTDLRTGTAGSAACTGGTRTNGTTGDVCDNNVFVTSTDTNKKQHMTTFTLGLGVDASLTYTTDYKTATDGDFYELTQGTRNWPVPVADKQTAVDDLWHAAVNGQGTYFSAKNPNQLTSSLSEALLSIQSKVGSGAAAATSTLNPVSGNNFTYVGSYTSKKWIGNLEARTVNVDTGKVSEFAFWCLETVSEDSCASPKTVETVIVGSSTQKVCRESSATLATCPAPAVFDGTNSTCDVEIATQCTGTMQSKVDVTADTRDIFMNVGGTLADFTAANLTVAGKIANFQNSFLTANLSQASLDFDDITTTSTAKKSLMTSSTLVSYLRGNTGYENRASNMPPTTATDNRIYRFREAILGDLVDSTPIFVGAPKANFSDPGYGTVATLGSFKETKKTRAGTVYIGANDGMLHAIDAANGEERWAYIPTMVLDNMWKLADKRYGNSVPHSYFVNGDFVANDICTANCTSSISAVWKTILVGALNGGGKGYFALDITDPDSPSLLWEFDTSDDSDLGYSYGNPVVTKKADGTWVVLLTSGYNNTTGSNPGKGFMYVLNAASGAVISKYSTGEGDATTPSGLAKINPYVLDGLVNNTALFVYGGDLLGNVWRFDINSPQSSTNPFKFAVLKDPSGVVQPITTRPELADVSGKRVVYVGTGRYLGVNDLTDTQQQTIYAISDETTGSPSTLDDPRSSPLMVKQVLVNDTGTATRTIQSPPKVVNFASGRGWYIDFLDAGERQNVPAQLVFGTLLLPTTVPTNTLCSPGGYGWLNFLDYKTGAAVSGTIVATKTNAPIVGINVLYVKGKPVVNIVTADNPTPTFPPEQPKFTGGSASGFTNHRVIWRELIEEQ